MLGRGEGAGEGDGEDGELVRCSHVLLRDWVVRRLSWPGRGARLYDNWVQYLAVDIYIDM